MRAGACALAAGLCIAACGAEADLLSVFVTARFDARLALDQLRISGLTARGDPAFAAALLPEPPEPLSSGSESFMVLVPASLLGRALALRLDGLSRAQVRATGEVLTDLSGEPTTYVEVRLGDPAVCGDGTIRPLIEACDDGNTDAGDGCDESCRLEPDFTCHSTPPSGPSVCKRIAQRSPAPLEGAVERRQQCSQMRTRRLS